jgi:hypothetical protein
MLWVTVLGCVAVAAALSLAVAAIFRLLLLSRIAAWRRKGSGTNVTKRGPATTK